MQARRIKVTPHYRQLHPRVRITSKLMLQGNWLEAAGFAPGTIATIEVQAGRLVITPATT
ncbi:type I addiction module toxin, SymE family [Hymenobacter sp. BT664]|uniref:Type I addiction module toxin, SymE family n=1 Tax=Hymenobacter montanus TaxID=2771359 RepID=A0A927GJG2_9BACT|nr:SymE family type I addiction module toxin [Hymenobacter montanus]MBD2768458.1 type I addiction module toxin, SymE family [Hymenobacter montanus]